MQLAQIISPCHTGWPNSIPLHAIQVVLKSFLRAIQVGQCSWPKSLLRAIPVGRIRYLSMPYRSANAVGPNHFSMPYGLAGSDTYLCHTGWPNLISICAIRVGRIRSYTDRVIQVGQCTWTKSFPRAIQVGRIRYLSVPYRSANAGGPNHCSVPYRLAGSDTYPCHTGRPMQLAHIIALCHTGWPMQLAQSFLRAIQVGRIRYLSVPYGLAGYDPIRVIQVGQCTWTKSFPRAIQVGRIRYLSVPTCMARGNDLV